MKAYNELVQHVLDNGSVKGDRTGVGTVSTFGHQVRFDLTKGFPLANTKKVNLKAVVYELLWFISGRTNVDYLNGHGVHIWDEWTDNRGELGPIYGSQWRDWVGNFGERHDQLAGLVEGIRAKPDSRRHIVSAWNVSDLPDESVSPEENVDYGRMALAPCHTMFQVYVHRDKLSLQLYQRSADVFLGVPFNIASYALLTMMLAQVCGLKAHEFVHTFGDLHLYLNHQEQAKELLTREPYPLPTVKLNPYRRELDDFEFDDFRLEGYKHHPPIKAPIAV